MAVLPVVRALSKAGKAAKQAVKIIPAHGTDIDNLDGILSKGLRRGSALDMTPTREWTKEYPVILDVPKARAGKYIEHNKFYESANTAMPSRVTVDIEQYTSAGAEEALEKINLLKEQYPQVKWLVKGAKELEDPNALTKKNLRKFFEKEGLTGTEADEYIKSELSDISMRIPQRMYGYKKPIHSIQQYKDYMDWLMQQ